MIILALYVVGMFLFIAAIFTIAGFAGDRGAPMRDLCHEDLIGISLLSTIWPFVVPVAIVFAFAWLMMKLSRRIVEETAKQR